MNTKKQEPKPFTADEEKQVLRKVGETITEKPLLTFDIPVKARRFIDKLKIRLKLAPSVHHIEILPQRTINVYRIASRAVTIDLRGINPDPKEIKSVAQGINMMMDLLARHGEDVFYIVACAIQNDDREPTKKVLDLVKNQMVIDDLFIILTYAISNYNIQAFFNSIVLIVGIGEILNLQKKASPQTTGV